MAFAVITGASRGIGLVTAYALADRGVTVFAGARRPEELAAAVAAGGANTVRAGIRPLSLDVTDDASIAAAVAAVELVTPSLDVLINNAGVPGSWAGPEEIGPEHFDDVLAVNVLGPVRVTRAFLPLLRRAERPRIVMVSSGMGSFASQTGDDTYREIAHLPYPASKAALNMLTVQYAKALPDVRVTAVDPGLTATEFTAGSGQTVEDGAAPVIAAALDTTGPSGTFRDAAGAASW